MVVLGRAFEARNEPHAGVLARQEGPLIRAQEGKASADQARDFLVPVDCLPLGYFGCKGLKGFLYE